MASNESYGESKCAEKKRELTGIHPERADARCLEDPDAWFD